MEAPEAELISESKKNDATFESVLQHLARQSRILLESHQCALSFVPDGQFHGALHLMSFSTRYQEYLEYNVLPTGDGLWALLIEKGTVMRMTQGEVYSHPRFEHFGHMRDTRGVEHPPLIGWLAAPISHDGIFLGVLQVSDKDSGEYNESDEAQIASVANMICPWFFMQHQATITTHESTEKIVASLEKLLNSLKD